MELVSRGNIEGRGILFRGFPKVRYGAVDPLHGKDGLKRFSSRLPPRLLGCLEADSVLLVLPDLCTEAFQGCPLGKHRAFQFREVAVELLLLLIKGGNACLAVGEL